MHWLWVIGIQKDKGQQRAVGRGIEGHGEMRPAGAIAGLGMWDADGWRPAGDASGCRVVGHWEEGPPGNEMIKLEADT